MFVKPRCVSFAVKVPTVKFSKPSNQFSQTLARIQSQSTIRFQKQQFHVSRTLFARVTDEEKPKRAASAYNLFMAEQLNKEKEAGGLMKDKMKDISAKWNALSDAQKKPYTDKAAAEKSKLDAEKKAKEEGVIKRPASAYMLFANDNRAKVVKENPGLKVTEVASKLGVLWKNLSEGEKKKYEDQYQRNKEEYEKKKAAQV